MNEPPPSLARRAAVIATAILATLLASMASAAGFAVWIRNAAMILGFVPDIPVFMAAFCAGTAFASPLLMRVGGVTKLWPAALVAVAAMGLTHVLFWTDRLIFFTHFLQKLGLPASEFPYHILLNFTIPQAVHVALGSLLCRMARGRHHHHAVGASS